MSPDQTCDIYPPEDALTPWGEGEYVDPWREDDDYEDEPDQQGMDTGCWFEMDAEDQSVLYFRGIRNSESQPRVEIPSVPEAQENGPPAHKPRPPVLPPYLQGVPTLQHYTSDMFGSMPDAGWVTYQVVREGGVGIIYGAPQLGKTVLILDWAASVALGIPWAGRSVIQGNVLFFVLEGASGTRERVLALQERLRVSFGETVNFVWDHVNLMKEEDVLKVIKLVLLLDCKLVFIDTLSSSLAGEGDENSNRDMSKFIHGAKLVAKATGAAVLITHHTGRDPNATMERGASALRGNVDTSIRVSKGENHHKWEVAKSRDGPLGVSGHFDIEPCEFVRQDTGEVVQSIVVKHLEIDGEGAGALNAQSAKLTGNRAAVLAQLKIQFAALPEEGVSLPFEDAVRLCRDAVTVNDSKHRSTRTREVLRSLVRTGHIHEREDGQLCLPAA